MNNDPQTSTLTRGKLLLIIGLSGTLFYVLPFGKSDSDSTPESSTVETTANSDTNVAIGKEAMEMLTKRLQSFPKFSMNDALEYDPFQRPELVSQATAKTESEASVESNIEANVDPNDSAPESTPEQPFTPQQLEITAIYNSPRGYSAVIDGEIYFVGDQLPNGHFVAAITPQAVRFALPTE